MKALASLVSQVDELPRAAARELAEMGCGWAPGLNKVNDSTRCGAIVLAIAALVVFPMKADSLSAGSRSATVTQTQPAAQSKTDGARFPSGADARSPRYQLSRGDVFELTFPFTPEFNQTVTVQPDGFVALLSVGDLNVAGKTVPELRNLVITAYSGILHDPVVNVSMKDFDKPYFIAGGEIGHPGKYELRPDVTLTEAIAIAGGFTENSKHSEVLLIRRGPNNQVDVRTFNVKKMLASGNLSEDLHLQSGDMFFVPQNRISKIRKYIPNPGIGMTGVY